MQRANLGDVGQDTSTPDDGDQPPTISQPVPGHQEFIPVSPDAQRADDPLPSDPLLSDPDAQPGTDA
jgi:hypothetical protein